MDNKPKLTVCIPCYGRPQRTERIIQQVVDQDMTGWEAFIIGDGCDSFQALIDCGYFEHLKRLPQMKGNNIIASNFPIHRGGWGYEIRNKVKELANGEYLIYVDNDDTILPNHFSNYLSGIEGTDYGMVYFNTYIKANNRTRVSDLAYGLIGHAEIIVKTEIARNLPPHTESYGHDWTFIKSIIDSGAKISKCENEPTYYVMSLGDLREQDID